MRFSLGFSLVAFMIALASARTITVNVGDKGLAFNPPSCVEPQLRIITEH